MEQLGSDPRPQHTLTLSPQVKATQPREFFSPHAVKHSWTPHSDKGYNQANLGLWQLYCHELWFDGFVKNLTLGAWETFVWTRALLHTNTPKFVAWAADANKSCNIRTNMLRYWRFSSWDAEQRSKTKWIKMPWAEQTPTNWGQQLHVSSDKVSRSHEKMISGQSNSHIGVWFSEPQIGNLQYHAVVFGSLFLVIARVTHSCSYCV